MTVADRVLTGLGAGFRRRAGELLRPTVEALTSQHDEVDALVGTATAPWQPAFDLDTTPIPGWLGQATGTAVPGGLSLDAQRNYVRDRPAQRRGSPTALVAAVRSQLRGGRRVTLIERDGGDAYRQRVQVYAAEVRDVDGDGSPDTAPVLAAALSQKPVGVILTIEVLSGATVEHMRTVHAGTVAAYLAEFPTVAAARDHVPE